MNDLETLQYLFDVQGYLVLENVLDVEEVAALNHLLDAHLPPAKGNRFGSAPDGPGFLDWGQPFIVSGAGRGIYYLLPAMIRTDFRASRAGEVLSVPLAMLSTISR